MSRHIVFTIELVVDIDLPRIRVGGRCAQGMIQVGGHLLDHQALRNNSRWRKCYEGFRSFEELSICLRVESIYSYGQYRLEVESGFSSSISLVGDGADLVMAGWVLEGEVGDVML